MQNSLPQYIFYKSDNYCIIEANSYNKELIFYPLNKVRFFKCLFAIITYINALLANSAICELESKLKNFRQFRLLFYGWKSIFSK